MSITQLWLANAPVVLTLVGIAIAFGRRLGSAETILRLHAERLDRHEERLIGLVGDVQRMIGHFLATQERLDRKTGA